MLEALVAQPHGDAEGAGSVVAYDHDWLIGVEFLVGAGGDFAHRHEKGVWKACGVVLPRFTDVEQEGRIGPIALFKEGLGGNFRVEHRISG